MEDNSNNGTNESDSESIIDTDDTYAGTSTLFRDGATENDLFPTTRLGNLDKNHFEKAWYEKEDIRNK